MPVRTAPGRSRGVARALLWQGRMRRLAVMLLVAGFGCGPESGAAIGPFAPVTAEVGREMRLAFRAPADVARLGFTSDLQDLERRRLKPTLTRYAGGEAVFRWTPLAEDLGEHRFRIEAERAGVTGRADLAVTVLGGDARLGFILPAGEGTTLDLTRQACAEVGLEVSDEAAAEVSFEPGDVWTDGGMLEPLDELTGRLRFCPTPAQAQRSTVFPFSIVARAAGGLEARKRYAVVLGAVTPPEVPPMSCTDAAPTIATTPHADITTAGKLHIYATVSDPQGIREVAVYWSTDPPAEPDKPDLTRMSRVTMLLVSGSSSGAQFAATLPNPVAAAMPGATAQIYYLIRAIDADDVVPGCAAHETSSPPMGVYAFTVKRSK